jgi:hypothetical protein
MLGLGAMDPILAFNPPALFSIWALKKMDAPRGTNGAPANFIQSANDALGKLSGPELFAVFSATN